jgi:hypothetical protein
MWRRSKLGKRLTRLPSELRGLPPGDAELIRLLGRGGWFFVVAPAIAGRLDLRLGPKRDIDLGGRATVAAPVEAKEHPHVYPPWFLDRILAVILPGARLEMVRQDRGIKLLLVPPAATDSLGDVPEGKEAHSTLGGIAGRLIAEPDIAEKYRRMGVHTAVLHIWAAALRARSQPDGELYYWFWSR